MRFSLFCKVMMSDFGCNIFRNFLCSALLNQKLEVKFMCSSLYASADFTAHVRFFVTDTGSELAVISVFNQNDLEFSSPHAFQKIVSDKKLCMLKTNQCGQVAIIVLASERARVLHGTNIERKIIVPLPKSNSVLYDEVAIATDCCIASISDEEYSGFVNISKKALNSIFGECWAIPVADVSPVKDTMDKTTLSAAALRASAPASATPAKPKSFFGKLGKLFG